MKKNTVILLVVAAVLISSIGFSSQAYAARVYVSPPEFVLDGTPDLVVIPGTYVYRVPDIETDILFYQGFWYRPYEGRWYRSRHHSGPFNHIGRIPGGLQRLPRDYRTLPFEPQHRIHYGEVNRHWRGWERSRHWHRDDRWRDYERRGHDRHRDGHDRGRGDHGHR